MVLESMYLHFTGGMWQHFLYGQLFIPFKIKLSSLKEKQNDERLVHLKDKLIHKLDTKYKCPSQKKKEDTEQKWKKGYILRRIV